MRFLRCRRAVLWFCPRWVECESPNIERRTANGTLTTRQKLSDLGKMATRAGHLPGNKGENDKKLPVFLDFLPVFWVISPAYRSVLGFWGRMMRIGKRKQGVVIWVPAAVFSSRRWLLRKRRCIRKHAAPIWLFRECESLIAAHLPTNAPGLLLVVSM